MKSAAYPYDQEEPCGTTSDTGIGRAGSSSELSSDGDGFVGRSASASGAVDAAAASRRPSAAQGRDSRATFELTDGDLALIYVYAPGRTIAPGESKRQATEPCQAVFDFAEDGSLLGVEVIARVPHV